VNNRILMNGLLENTGRWVFNKYYSVSYPAESTDLLYVEINSTNLGLSIQPIRLRVRIYVSAGNSAGYSDWETDFMVVSWQNVAALQYAIPYRSMRAPLFTTPRVYVYGQYASNFLEKIFVVFRPSTT